MEYQQAWELQEQVHARVAEGGEEEILVVEHPAVVTLGRKEGVVGNLRVSPEYLAANGVQLVQSDRGGDITLHAPGQLVVYPIIRLIDHKLSVGGYVHGLEKAVIAALGGMGIVGFADPKAPGVWVKGEDGEAAKICAVGVRVRRGVTMHGLALNVCNDLSLFELIVPCGLAGRAVTSVERVGGGGSVAEVGEEVCRELVLFFEGR
jgi:lipoyl(octanoyl) transferase